MKLLVIRFQICFFTFDLDFNFCFLILNFTFQFSPFSEEVAIDYELSRLRRELKSTATRGRSEADGVSGDDSFGA